MARLYNRHTARRTRSLPNPLTTRFAPSPTGHLHLGHAYAALYAHDLAEQTGGSFVLRIEDIDPGRCRPVFEDRIFEDLAWLGLEWQEPVLRQSVRLEAYGQALDRLREMDLLYPCFCTRREIAEEIGRASAAPHLSSTGPDGPIYPGICRRLDRTERQARIDADEPHAWRLDMQRAQRHARGLTWVDLVRGEQTATPEIFGDVVLARKDVATSYHLAVTLDDAMQEITVVTRAEDLLPATHIHRLLQTLLDLPVPKWQHHPLLTDNSGKRFAKRDRAVTIRELRDDRGLTPQQVRDLALSGDS